MAGFRLSVHSAEPFPGVAVGWAGAGVPTAGRGRGDGPTGVGERVPQCGGLCTRGLCTWGPAHVALQRVQGKLCADGARALRGLWGAGAAGVPPASSRGPVAPKAPGLTRQPLCSLQVPCQILPCTRREELVGRGSPQAGLKLSLYHSSLYKLLQ